MKKGNLEVEGASHCKVRGHCLAICAKKRLKRSRFRLGSDGPMESCVRWGSSVVDSGGPKQAQVQSYSPGGANRPMPS